MSNIKFFCKIHKDTPAILPEQLGETYDRRSQKHMACPLWDRTLQVQSFVRHCRHIHPNNDKPELSDLIYTPKSEAPVGTNFRAEWHATNGVNCCMECPVKGCKAKLDQPAEMHWHFATMHHHERYLVEVYDARGPNEPRHMPYQFNCPNCNARKANPTGAHHLGSKACRDMIAMRAKEQNKQTYKDKRDTAFFKHGDNTLNRVELFWYLGRLFLSNDNDTPRIRANLKKASLIATWGFCVLTRLQHKPWITSTMHWFCTFGHSIEIQVWHTLAAISAHPCRTSSAKSMAALVSSWHEGTRHDQQEATMNSPFMTITWAM